jgi:hypothetical protein
MRAISLSTHLAALPTDWGGVTLAQAVKLAALSEDASIQEHLAILLQCSPEELLHLAPKHLQRALSASFFVLEPMPDHLTWPRPTSIMLGEVEVPILDTLEGLAFGQSVDIGAAIQEMGQDISGLRIRVLATILQPAYDGTAYDSDKAMELEPLCATVKLCDAIPLCDFFLPTTTASVGATPPSSSASP